MIMVGDAPFLPDIWGCETSGEGDSYVLKSGEAQRRPASDMLSIPNNVVEWLDNTLITLDNRRIKRIEIVSEKGQAFVMALVRLSAERTSDEPATNGYAFKVGSGMRERRCAY